MTNTPSPSNKRGIIEALAPDPSSEQRKFYESLKALSKSFQSSLNELEKLSVFALMPEERLREEAELRGLVQHHSESLPDFRSRVSKAEEWQRLAGTKLGIEKFLKYLGYSNYRFERVRDFIPQHWNEVHLYLKTLKTSASDAEYLDFLLSQLKPAIVVFRVYYHGDYRLAWTKPTRSEGDGVGSVQGQSWLAQNPTFKTDGTLGGQFYLPDFKQYDMNNYEQYDR